MRYDRDGEDLIGVVVRGHACRDCEIMEVASVAPAIIDRGLATPGLLASVMTAKYGEHLPLYRLEQIAERSGVELARSTMADW
ncbi:MAG: hypothetical protein B7Z60_09865 [Ferrovum sp. 37-45-19]|nr:MAG: hypothetical protein B7Z60_09865 [Ferrovum sp. 37-45-19]